jgi:hypothetical protein
MRSVCDSSAQLNPNIHCWLQELGLKELLAVYQEESCMRQFCATLILLGYHLFLTTNMGKPSDCDIRQVLALFSFKSRAWILLLFLSFYKKIMNSAT